MTVLKHLILFLTLQMNSMDWHDWYELTANATMLINATAFVIAMLLETITLVSESVT